jgi:hypothetical protein
MKTESVNRLTAEQAVRKTNPIPYHGESRMKVSFGANNGRPRTYTEPRTIAAPKHNSRPVLIWPSGLSAVGRKRMKVLLNPRRLRYEISDVAEMSNVASPIWLALKRRALSSQKRKPRTPMVEVVRAR